MLGINKRQVGSAAESMAADYLKSLGYKILDKNFTIRGGEIDLIARDRDILVFVEVKMRLSNEFGTALESINYFKIKALKKTSLFYIQKIKWGDKPYRFDLVTIDHEFGETKIDVVRNIIS